MKFCKVCGYPENAHPYRHSFEPDEFRRGPSTWRIDCSQPNEVNVPRAETAWDRLCAEEDAEDDDE